MIDSLAAARAKLETLAGTRSPKGEVLSIAVSTSRLDDWRQSVPTYLHSEFSRVVKERGLSGDDRRRLQAGLEQSLELLKYDVTASTQGLAMFTDGGSGVGERIELPLRLVNCLTIEPWPYIRPVAHALSMMEPFVLAEVSRDDSSLYLVDEWGVVIEDDHAGPWLRTSDRETGEVSIKKYYAAARRDSLVEHHHKEVAASLVRLLEMSGARQVVLCAQHEIAAAFRRALSGATAGAVVAEIPLDAAASSRQSVAGARKAIEQARQDRMAALAARIKEGLGPNGHGVSGIEGVLGAVQSGRLQTLLVDRGYRIPGWLCASCPWVGFVEARICPQCGSGVTPVPDVVGEVVRLTVLEHGQVEVGEQVAGLDELGGVAGLLRYA